MFKLEIVATIGLSKIIDSGMLQFLFFPPEIKI